MKAMHAVHALLSVDKTQLLQNLKLIFTHKQEQKQKIKIFRKSRLSSFS